MNKNLPNILTFSRIILIPIILICYLFGGKGYFLSSNLFLIACITDFLDGYFARAFSIQSNLGSFLDPIADKLLVGCLIVLLTYYHKIDLLPSLAIIFREILVSGLREFLADLRVSVPVSKMAKLKTFCQMIAIYLLLIGSGEGYEIFSIIGRILIWIAAGITLLTGYAYLRAGLKHID